MTRQELQSAPNAAGQGEPRHIAGTVLVRIATAAGHEAEIARDLAPLMTGPKSLEVWRIELGRLLAALVAGGLVERDGDRLSATPRGQAAAIEFLAVGKSLPASWEAARDGALVARALALGATSKSRLKAVGKVDGLRAMIVVHHWKLKVRGVPSAPRLRSMLAVKALGRAFGNQLANGLGDKSALPAKAGRLLAGQLAESGREYATDARLVAALAAEAVKTKRSDLKSLRLGVLRTFLGQTAAAGRPPRVSRRKSRPKLAAPASVVPASGTPGANLSARLEAARSGVAITAPRPPAPTRSAPPQLSDATIAARPDPEGFAREVLAAADVTAEGWAGNRRAFISRVWQELHRRHPHWSLTEIEFKCMLTEAHRSGLVALVNADLKNKSAIKELQASAVVYKNTVWHYVRAPE